MSLMTKPYIVYYRWIPSDGGQAGVDELRIENGDMHLAVEAAQTACRQYNLEHPYEEGRTYDEVLGIKYKPWQPRY